MRAVAWVALGAGVGLFVGLRLRPATETSCCRRVRAGVKERLGPLGGLADSLGLIGASPEILDALGV